MALPPEHRTPRVERLENIVNGALPEKLFNFPTLTQIDHSLIGAYVQLYNYVDLNIRRSIETFAQAGLLKGKAVKLYPKINGPTLTNAVQDVVASMDPSIENITESLGRLQEIERRREFRNLMGHWAARRIANEDAIVLMTKNEADAKQISGRFVGTGAVKTAILDLADVRGLLTHLGPYEVWLAMKTSEWRKRYIGD